MIPGFTVHLLGDPTDEGYVVGGFGMSKTVPADQAVPATAEFVASAAYFGEEAVGGWHDPDTDEFVLDVVHIFEDLDTALYAGRQNKQKTIWDLREGVEIPVTREEVPLAG